MLADAAATMTPTGRRPGINAAQALRWMRGAAPPSDEPLILRSPTEIVLGARAAFTPVGRRSGLDWHRL